MRLLRFLALFLYASMWLLPSSFAQSAQRQSDSPAQAAPTQQSPSPGFAPKNHLPNGPADPWTFMRKNAANAVCGSIVSYNFSAGENPRLLSVTTCTTGGKALSRRVHKEGEMKLTLPQWLLTNQSNR